MDTSVKLKTSTEKISIWNAIKSFFADSVDENEIDEEKIKEIEKQQDSKHIEKLEKYVSTIETRNSKSKSKNNLKIKSKITEKVSEKKQKKKNINENDKQKER